MQKLTISIPHQLTRAEARKRIEQHVGELNQQYAGALGRLEERWDGDTLHFTLVVTGATIPGQLFVEEHAVRVEVPLPWPLAMLAGSVQHAIEDQGRKLLGRG